jgi:hypothetical protein
MRLADLNGDGDHRLLIADMDRKLKIYKGTTVVLMTMLKARIMAQAPRFSRNMHYWMSRWHFAHSTPVISLHIAT